MNVIKKNEVTFIDRDIYRIENIRTGIIINNNDTGITILNNNLVVMRDIFWYESVYIYAVLKKSDDTSVVLYCPEEYCFIYIDMHQEEISVISLGSIQGIISPVYSWMNDALFFATYDDKYYVLSVSKKNIVEIPESEFSRLHPSLAALRNHALCCDQLYSVNTYENSCVGTLKNEALIFDNTSRLKVKIPYTVPVCHDIVFHKGLICFVSEKLLTFEKSGKSWKVNPKTDAHSFLQVRLIEEKQIVYAYVLSATQAHNYMNTITKYEIGPDKF